MKTDNQADLISVIVPVYNVEKYVVQCLQSILAQTYQNIEVIVINDGSKDGSLELCLPFESDPRVRIINNSNHGLGYSRQIGFDLAKGEFACSFDSDDYLAPDMLEKLYAGITTHNADICVCGRVDLLDEKGKGRTQQKPITDQESVIDVTQERIVSEFRTLSYRVSASDTWNKLYRRRFLTEAKVKFTVPKAYRGTDAQFNNVLLLHCPKYVLLPECFYYHRMFGVSIVRSNSRDLQGSYQFLLQEIMTEAAHLGFLNHSSFQKQIAGIYYSLLYSASFDIAMGCHSFHETNEKLKTVHKRFAEFCNEYPFFMDYSPKDHDKKKFIHGLQKNKLQRTAWKLDAYRNARMIKNRLGGAWNNVR